MKKILPRINFDQKPEGLSFKVPESAIARWDKTIQSAGKGTGAGGEIEILGEIGYNPFAEIFTTVKSVKDQLKAIGKNPVLVTLNSPGGDAHDGIAIYNLLREHGDVTVNVLGIAASAASIIAMAGDKIIMGSAAMLMIHSAWGMVIGNAADMREMSDVLGQIDMDVSAVYGARANMPQAEVLAMMKKETWLSAADAVKFGFADVATSEQKAKPKSSNLKPVFLQAPKATPGASAGKARSVVYLKNKPGVSGINPLTPERPK